MIFYVGLIFSTLTWSPPFETKVPVAMVTHLPSTRAGVAPPRQWPNLHRQRAVTAFVLTDEHDELQGHDGDKNWHHDSLD
jgi:hypothetical protein